MKKTYYCIDHQGKASAYKKALDACGCKELEDYHKADFLLSDVDFLGRTRYFDFFREVDRPTFIYPHTARPVLQWDGLYPPHSHVTAIFTIAQGGIDVPRAYGFTETPIHAVGWTYGEIVPFQAHSAPRRILYAPIHVNGNAFMTDRERGTNVEVYRRLLRLVAAGMIDLTVRYLHELEWNGLWEVPGVTFVKGEPDQSHKEIDEADVVVSHQNMGYIAVARGKPTLFMDEGQIPISGNVPHNVKMVKSWDKYKEMLIFPLDILENENTMSLIRDSARSDDKIKEWRTKYIGEPFDPAKFIEIWESYL